MTKYPVMNGSNGLSFLLSADRIISLRKEESGYSLISPDADGIRLFYGGGDGIGFFRSAALVIGL